MVATTEPPVADQQPHATTATTESLPDLRILKVPVVESAFQVRVCVCEHECERVCVCACARLEPTVVHMALWQFRLVRRV